MKTVEMEESESRRFRRGQTICHEDEPGGLFGSVRYVLAHTLAFLESRIELITVELKELKFRALSALIWGVGLLFLSMLTLVSIMGVVVFALWQQALPVLMGFSLFFIVLAIGSFLAARAKLNKIPFGDTVEQLRKDRDLVLKKSSAEENDSED